MRKACSSLAERCFNTAEQGVRFLPRLPFQVGRSWLCPLPVRYPPIAVWRRSDLPEVDVTNDRCGQTVQDHARPPTQRRAARVWAGLSAGCFVVMSLTGCGFNPFGSSAPPPVVEKSAPKAAEDYIIGSGDQLSIFVYRNPDLSEGGVAVRPDGRISTPLIEDIVAAGKTPTSLAREIEERLTKYIQEPNVTVIVRGFIGPTDRQVRVIGEATDPVAIPYRDHMTLLDVMIATRGLTKYAAGNRAVVVRTDPEGKRQTIKVRLSDLIKDGDIGQNIEMTPGDTIIIPQTWF
jgi:polysaccharide export outer membrane protein